MKYHTIKRIAVSSVIGWLLLLMLMPQLLPSCKKVDEHADLIEGQPYIVTTTGLGGLLGIWAYNYQKNFIVGDTATLVGKLFLDRAGTSIMVGTTPVTIIKKLKAYTGVTNQRTGRPDSVDVCRFLITKDMVGKNLPLTVSANGYSVQGAPVTVLLINTGDRKTDTTLVVDKLGSWLPANASAFRSGSIPFVSNASVSADGTIYFDNLNGLFKLANQQVSQVFAPGSTITDQSQHSFTIDVVLSSLISMDGSTLYFSTLDKENVDPSADSVYIARLCSMNVPTGQVTTMNRTTVFKGYGTYSENPAPFSGNIGSLKIVACNLSADINGNLFFTNFYFPENTGLNDWTYDKFNASTQWYPTLQQANSIYPIFGILGNVCKLDMSGNVTSEVQTGAAVAYGYKPPYSTPGPLFNDIANSFLSSPDGTLLYGFKNPASGFTYDLNQFDLTQQDIENRYIAQDNSYHFTSFDTASATRLPSNSSFSAPGVANYGEFWNYLILPNNDILFSNFSSLFAYNMSAKTVYCYAGAENENTSVQTNETGNAKFVNYGGPSLRFCGLDRNGAVYYCIGGSPDLTISTDNDYVNGVRFYKLHPAGK